MRTARQEFRDDGMVNEFFEREQQLRPQQRLGPGRPFEMSDLHRELDAVRVGGWANEFQQAGPRLREISAEEEAAMEKAFQESRAAAGPTMNASGEFIFIIFFFFIVRNKKKEGNDDDDDDDDGVYNKRL